MELLMEEPLSTHGIVFRPHPWKIRALCKVLRLPSGDMVRLGDDLWPITVSACTAATAIFTGVRVRHAFGLVPVEDEGEDGDKDIGAWSGRG